MADAFDERLESVRRDHPLPASLDSAKRYQRSRWLTHLLWGNPGVSLAAEWLSAPSQARLDTLDATTLADLRRTVRGRHGPTREFQADSLPGTDSRRVAPKE